MRIKLSSIIFLVVSANVFSMHQRPPDILVPGSASICGVRSSGPRRFVATVFDVPIRLMRGSNVLGTKSNPYDCEDYSSLMCIASAPGFCKRGFYRSLSSRELYLVEVYGKRRDVSVTFVSD